MGEGPLAKLAYREIVEIGLVVAYARPFSKSNKVAFVGERDASPDDPELARLHQQILDRRNDFYAHNGREDLRQIVDTLKMLGLGEGGFEEAYPRISAFTLPDMLRLAESQRERFGRLAEETYAVWRAIAPAGAQPTFVVDV